MSRVLCVDFGSTFTKAALVDVSGELLGTASHRTTIDTDVLDGLAACQDLLDAADVPVLACSSAGGGLRIAVVGNEELVTSEAGRRVALSSGGKVVHVGSGGLEQAAYADLLGSEPDVLLLVGGTDGGNHEGLLADAEFLARAHWDRPVVVAGDIEARDRVAGLLGDIPHVLADNVVPRIGVLAPDSARAAIREMFLEHVIGGKGLSRGPRFAELVRGATPDILLRGLEVLAEVAGDTVAVDIGGATTDVHSVIELDPEEANLGREVVANSRITRTVEGDLGMRWSAETTAQAAADAGLDTGRDTGLDTGRDDLADAARIRRADPDFLPATPAEQEQDVRLAEAALVLAVRRHAGRSVLVVGPDGRVIERSGRDLREIDLLVGSGGVLRHSGAADRILAGVIGRSEDGWQYPEDPRVVIDSDYVLAAIGLLAESHRATADVLARRLATPPHG